jgi:hypothetical protein
MDVTVKKNSLKILTLGALLLSCSRQEMRLFDPVCRLEPGTVLLMASPRVSVSELQSPAQDFQNGLSDRLSDLLTTTTQDTPEVNYRLQASFNQYRENSRILRFSENNPTPAPDGTLRPQYDLTIETEVSYSVTVTLKKRDGSVLYDREFLTQDLEETRRTVDDRPNSFLGNLIGQVQLSPGFWTLQQMRNTAERKALDVFIKDLTYHYEDVDFEF